MVREAAVIGYFYPNGLNNITDFIDSLGVIPPEKKIDAFGIISPHAGYVYSGKTAYTGFSNIKIKKTVIIIGPNHTGAGAAYSVLDRGYYSFGDFKVEINKELASAIIGEEGSPFVADDLAHSREHSVEVQIPLIYNLTKDFKIVPIVVSLIKRSDIEPAAAAIYNAIKKLSLTDDVLIVASTDMTHYESSESAKAKDSIAIKEILDMNPDGLYDKVIGHRISMCGFVPVTIMLKVAILAGKNHARLLSYTNSGDITGDYSNVVGYSSIAIY